MNRSQRLFRPLQKLDPALLIGVVILMGISLAVLYSGSQESLRVVFAQLFHFAIGLLC
jgi:hypothetical protein